MQALPRGEPVEQLAWLGDERYGSDFGGRDGEALTARRAQRRFELWLRPSGIRA